MNLAQVHQTGNCDHITSPHCWPCIAIRCDHVSLADSPYCPSHFAFHDRKRQMARSISVRELGVRQPQVLAGGQGGLPEN